MTCTPPRSPTLGLITLLLAAERTQPTVSWLELAVRHNPDLTLGEYVGALKYIIGSTDLLHLHPYREKSIVYELQFWKCYDPLISIEVPISEVAKIFPRRGDHVPSKLS
ncbi:hypothetical protein [Phyllobacterium lublinensis]|uniref:hypothetical protein n=1 Tax=Phyllobacterium lublinensis TaxID=2875708 RepID=UPI001CCE808F|nr:hypothetical protein [Phyllobacterium sp. 2063]MBZ9655805.1 hypothetical protein [Phyllobacterium sp. 2063]